MRDEKGRVALDDNRRNRLFDGPGRRYFQNEDVDQGGNR